MKAPEGRGPALIRVESGTKAKEGLVLLPRRADGLRVNEDN
jgi:hypothetical protein